MTEPEITFERETAKITFPPCGCAIRLTPGFFPTVAVCERHQSEVKNLREKKSADEKE